MPDPRAARRDPVADDPLAALNDHLGRFLRQADALLDEYTRFSADLRARLAAESDRLGATVAAATDASLDRALSRLHSRLASLTAPRPHLPRSLLVALVLSLACNLALAALLLVRHPSTPVSDTKEQVTDVSSPQVSDTEEQGTVVPSAQVSDTEEQGTVVPIDAGVVDAGAVDAAPAKAVRPVVKPPPRRRRK